MNIFKPKTYTGCDDLPLYNFMKVITTNDLQYLVISGKAKNLPEIWEKISEQYSELSGDTDTNKFLLDCVKDITYLTNKIYLIETIVNSILGNYSEELCTILNDMGFTFTYSNDDDLPRKLKLTISQAKTFLIDLEQRKKELQGLKKGDDGEMKDGDFEVQLAIYSRFVKGVIDPRTMSVAQFIGIQKAYKLINSPQS